MENTDDGRVRYLVAWEGYDDDHDSWEPAENLHPATIAEYEEAHAYEVQRLANIRANQQYLRDVFADVEVHCRVNNHSCHHDAVCTCGCDVACNGI